MLGGGGYANKFMDLKNVEGGRVMQKYVRDLKKMLGGGGGGYAQIFYRLEKCGGGGMPTNFMDLKIVEGGGLGPNIS